MMLKRWRTRAILGCFLLTALGCRPGDPAVKADAAAGSRASSEALQILFIGNSLTQGIPELVESMAAAGGVSVRTRGEIGGGLSLSDHWKNGRAARALAAGRWDYVVLQQGPSTLPESQRDLHTWAVRWADEARRRHARTALYMVWPFRAQPERFPLVARSYRAAATAAGAQLFPAGEAWQDCLQRHPTLALYADELHANRAGAYLAALVITRGLTGVEPRSVPARLKLRSGSAFAIPEDQAEKLRQSAQRVGKGG